MCEDVDNCYCDEELIDLEQLVVNKVDLASMRAKRFNKKVEAPRVEDASDRARGFNLKIDNLVRELQY
ncbi:MAG: hypothetical protein NTV30_01550 [Chloroflexi bacterium]|nr:hypothetical protein [Chloroflexota bacterium]